MVVVRIAGNPAIRLSSQTVNGPLAPHRAALYCVQWFVRQQGLRIIKLCNNATALQSHAKSESTPKKVRYFAEKQPTQGTCVPSCFACKN
jgi:hypothetical protein